jgi:tRNA-splicing ligase RtcB (3'-phosphate/5'-hydroxy nucleic acid ligase)
MPEQTNVKKQSSPEEQSNTKEQVSAKDQLKQISDTIWELPTSFKKGMLVPAKIVASKELIESMDEGVFNQISNVATLPGIVDSAFCMADGHWGYGFPIGGVAAFDVENGGVISPGGIGFDINCLHPDTKILTNYGYFKKIKDFADDLGDDISFMDLETKKKESSKAMLFMSKEADNKIFKIKTKFGEEIILSEDHPLYGGDKFKIASELKVGDKIITHPFTGVEFEDSDEIIISESEFREIVGERDKIIKELKQRNLLPLTTKSTKLPILAKLLGFLTGDGWLGSYYSQKRKMDIWSMRAIGKVEDLNEISRDVNKLGYDANHISTNKYNSEISSKGEEVRVINGESSQLHINSQSLSLLLYVLGLPKGNKSRKETKIPTWVKQAPLWIKRLYLAGLFGAELTKPLQRKNEQYNFTEPSFSQNKINDLERENMNFFLDIINLLSEFGINTNKIYRQKGVVNSYGEETHKLALRISANADNLIKLWSTIGYEYCMERKKISLVAVAYLKYKHVTLSKTRNFIDNAKEQLDAGSITKNEIYALAENNGISQSLVKGQLLAKYNSVRITQNFIMFSEFLKMNLFGDFIRDEIEQITVENYNGDVYDFTMNDVNHNFIANNIVSHNCGMRLMTTGLTIDEVKPKIKELVDELYKAVPAGVGCKGFVKITKEEFVNVMRDGAQWCEKNGYATKDDIKHIEDNGKIKQADPSTVSDKAVKRGFDQIGTLGSGNHYLEIQEVKEENIYDKKAADIMGVKAGQIVVMVHCGSRGMGHQVGTDYLRKFLEVMPKYGIEIVDKELACAPFKSKEGQDYYKAMACAANMAFANRQVITHRIREVFDKVFAKKNDIRLVYDVAHNIAKLEKYVINGEEKELLVHRKGSTRAFGPSRSDDLPEDYKEIGQPVILGGSMETGSWLLLGTDGADATFGSTAHGAGRTMSRKKAKELWKGEELQKDMEKRGIYVHGVTMRGLAEEAGKAYKDVDEVVDSLAQAGITKKVVALKPIGNVKG